MILFLLLALQAPLQSDEIATINALILKLRSDRIEERSEASSDLYAIGKRAVPYLRAAVDPNNEELKARISHIIALVETRDTIPPRILRLNPNCVELLCSADKHEATSLFLKTVEAQGKGNTPSVTRDDLGAIVGKAFLGARDDEETISVIHAVRSWGIVKAIPDLMQCMRSTSIFVRGQALDALGRIGGENESPVIREFLSSSGYSSDRLSAIEVLGNLRDPASIPTLRPFLDRSDGCEGYAAEALAKLGDAASERRISELLRNKKGLVRAQAIESLEQLNASASLVKIRGFLEDDDELTRTVAIRAVGRLGTSEDLPAFRLALTSQSGAVRGAAIDALCNSNSAVDTLLTVATGKDEDDRISAIQGLGRLHSEKASASLIRLLDDPSARVRIASGNSLCALGGREGVPTLLREGKYFFLNALRRSPAWDRLATQSPVKDAYASPYSHLAAVADALGLGIRFVQPPGDVEEAFFQGKCLQVSQHERLVDVIVRILERSRSAFEVVLESDTLVVLKKEDAKLFWEKWIRDQR